jgi:hypothetical protein
MVKYIELLLVIANSFLYYVEKTFLNELISVCIHIFIVEEVKQDPPPWPREKRQKPTLRFQDKVQKTSLILHPEVSTLSRPGCLFLMFYSPNWYIILMIPVTMKNMT